MKRLRSFHTRFGRVVNDLHERLKFGTSVLEHNFGSLFLSFGSFREPIGKFKRAHGAHRVICISGASKTVREAKSSSTTAAWSEGGATGLLCEPSTRFDDPGYFLQISHVNQWISIENKKVSALVHFDVEMLGSIEQEILPSVPVHKLKSGF